jgi:hypothetical protein
MSVISALSLSACWSTTSTGVFFFHGLRPGAAAVAAFGLFGFCIGTLFIPFLVGLNWFFLVDLPRFELPIRVALHEQFDMVFEAVYTRAGRVARECQAHSLHNPCFISGVLKVWRRS